MSETTTAGTQSTEQSGAAGAAQLQKGTGAAVAVRPVLPLVPTTFDEVHRIAEALKGANLLPDHLRNNPDNLKLIILTGAELGMSPAQATRELYAVKGAVRESALSMVARVKSSPLCRYFRVVESTDTKCVCETFREGEGVTRYEYTLEDARKAGLLNGKGDDNWSRRPKLMLRRRCQSELAADTYADVLKGMVPREDAEEEAALEVEHRAVQTTPPPSPAKESKEKESAPAKTLRRVDEAAAPTKKDQQRHGPGEPLPQKPQRPVEVELPAPAPQKEEPPATERTEHETDRAFREKYAPKEPSTPPAEEPPADSTVAAASSVVLGIDLAAESVGPELRELITDLAAAKTEKAVTEVSSRVGTVVPPGHPYRQAVGVAFAARRKQLKGGG